MKYYGEFWTQYLRFVTNNATGSTAEHKHYKFKIIIKNIVIANAVSVYQKDQDYIQIRIFRTSSFSTLYRS